MSKLNINGEIDEIFNQSKKTRDCWILSSLLALASTQKGQDIIKEAICINENEDVKVTFKGIGKSYIVTKGEIEKYDTDDVLYDDFSNGDNDVLAFELATAKLRIDLAKGLVKTNNSLYDYNNLEEWNLATAVSYGYSAAMMFYMTGMNPTFINSTKLSAKENIVDVLKSIKTKTRHGETVMTFSLKQGVSSAYCLEPKGIFKIELDSAHSFAVKKLDRNTITFVNPWRTSKEYIMSWNDFVQMKINEITYLIFESDEPEDAYFDSEEEQSKSTTKKKTSLIGFILDLFKSLKF